MHTSVVIFLLFIFVETLYTMQCPNKRAPLASIRKRRYLNFPAKTDMVLTMSLLKAFMTHAPSGWNIVMEVDVIFPMPDANFTNAHWRRKLHHRQKREFWQRIHNAIDLHNVNGRACVLKSVCEAKKYLAPPGKSLVHDILRAIFTSMLGRTRLRPSFDLTILFFPPNEFTILRMKKAIAVPETISRQCQRNGGLSGPWKSRDISGLVDVYDQHLPLEESAPIHEDDFQNEMKGSYDEILSPDFCEGAQDCPFSILECLLSLNKINY